MTAICRAQRDPYQNPTTLAPTYKSLELTPSNNTVSVCSVRAQELPLRTSSRGVPGGSKQHPP